MNQRPSGDVFRANIHDHDARSFKLRLFMHYPQERSITWQRSMEMHGTIQLDPEATWEQVEKALAAGCYYLDD